MAITLIMHVGVQDLLGAFAVVGLCLLAILFIFLIVLVITYQRKRYYQRIRLGSPNLSKPDQNRPSNAIRWLIRIILIILVIAAVVLMLFYLANQASILAPAGVEKLNSTSNISNANISDKENTPVNYTRNASVENISSGESQANTTLSQAAGGVSVGEKVREFMLAYAGYIIAGFIILIILISVLGSKKSN